MHRPTRKLRNVTTKLDAKKARSRKSGSKAKRWKVAVDAYKHLSKDFEGEAPPPPPKKKKAAAAEDEG
jgi:hypothetical protein